MKPKRSREGLPKYRGGHWDSDRYETSKRIDTYNYGTKDSAHTFEVDLYIVRNNGESLAAYCAELKIRTDDRTLGDVKQKMADAIEEKISYTWEPWLEIEVTSFVPDDPDLFSSVHGKISLEIETTRYELTEREGKKFHRHAGDNNRRAVMKDWPKPKRQHSSTEVRGMNSGHNWSGSAVIRDTPEARAALGRIQDAMNTLVSKLNVLLSQEQIEATIQHVLSGSNAFALPSDTAKPSVLSPLPPKKNRRK